MDLRAHLFYHELLNDRCSLADAVRTFEKVAADCGISPADLRREAESEASPDEVERVFGARLFQWLFSSHNDEEVRDFINLAHKEALARELSVLLHTDEVELGEVESALTDFAELPLGESQVSTNIAIGVRVRLISAFISDNLFYLGVAKFHITMRDMEALLKCVIGKYGQRCRIGGKSAGMILANRILRPMFGGSTGFEDRIAEVNSHYLTAQVFNRFIQHNRLEEGHALKYLDAEEGDKVRAELEPRFRRGTFPEDVLGQLRDLMEKLGDQPLIVRSSSLLEDSMGFPFYGKYESVFISNMGTLDERFEELLSGIKQVYVSILASSVIEYRKDKALLDYEDMMSVLIQQVVGSRHGPYFFPATAGVAFSRNQYCWSTSIDPADGVARIVHGLGTRAVDRGGDDYPRLVALGRPGLRPEGSLKEKLKYSQRYVDVLNLETRELETVHFTDLYNRARESGDDYRPAHALSLIREDRLDSGGLYPRALGNGEAAITFDGLLGNSDFPGLLRGVLQLLEEAYGVPVDVEFACEGDMLYILQCRPLAEWTRAGASAPVPAAAGNQRLLFETRRDVFRGATVENIRYVVYVDGDAYAQLPSHAEKLEVARVVGRINRALKGQRFILIGPGRWGTVNPDLGVKVSYGDINNTLMLIEVAHEKGGYRPELSYGTHFFQDLIEADIIPLALFPGDRGSLDTEHLQLVPDALAATVGADLRPEGPLERVVKLVDLDESGPGRLCVYMDAAGSHAAGLVG